MKYQDLELGWYNTDYGPIEIYSKRNSQAWDIHGRTLDGKIITYDYTDFDILISSFDPEENALYELREKITSEENPEYFL